MVASVDLCKCRAAIAVAVTVVVAIAVGRITVIKVSIIIINMIVTVNRQQAAGKPATTWLRGTKPLARPQRLALISASFGKAATGG